MVAHFATYMQEELYVNVMIICLSLFYVEMQQYNVENKFCTC